ncbi:MAG: amidohydrolase family protein [candidate division NC10 bacterium]|nr:amidohydrolase family protein [candidate division NC10 bacterium]
MEKGDRLNQRIRREMEDIFLVDTHEHTVPEGERNRQATDFFSIWLLHYASSDLVSAGMGIPTLERVRDASRPLEERWKDFAPFWQHARSTGYGRALLLAARDLFGIEDINEATWRDLSEKITAAHRPGWYRTVMKEKAKIEVAILDPIYYEAHPVDYEIFAPVARFDSFIAARTRAHLDVLEEATACSIHSLGDLETALEAAFARALERGIVAVKTALAYFRTLDYRRPTRHEAEVVFNRIVSHVDPLRFRVHPGGGEGPAWDECKPLQDYLMHQVIRHALEHHLPIQVHTGLQEGVGNALSNAQPLHLTDLFLEYSQVQFDLFHAGYPYSGEVACLAKNFPNVWADLCWVWIISPHAGRRILHEWIETIPSNKILGFGGDYRFVEGSYAHSRLAREGIAQVLSEKVKEGYLSEEEALGMGRKILRENAWDLFRLEKRKRV